MRAKNLQKYKKELEEKVKREKGEEYFQKHKKFLDKQWNDLVEMGFVIEDPDASE